MKSIALLVMLFVCFMVTGQQSISQNPLQDTEKLLNWLENLSEKGLEVQNDSLIMGKEFQKVLQDENYWKLIFPETYTWEQTIQFIQTQELKQAFWYMINLYPENETNKELVVKSVLAYDKLFKMDEVLVNTFYTYCFFDPEASEINNGTPQVIRPDILEDKLASVKEIVNYIYYFRDRSK